MGKENSSNIILTGFSYTGKTQVAGIVAERLGWEVFDTDEQIIRLAGKSIQEIFAENGENDFRQLERRALEDACKRTHTVISTGGGIVMSDENRRIMSECGVVVCLEAKPETIYRRLTNDAQARGYGVVRPLLDDADPMQRITSLKEIRQNYYAECDWTIHTDHLTPEEVAGEVIHGWNVLSRVVEFADAQKPACVVTTPTESYPVFIGWDIMGSLGEKMARLGLADEAYIISDDLVFPLYGERVKASLEKSGFTVDSLVVPHGEMSKFYPVAMRIYDFLVLHRAERSHSIVALGGGVVGDLAGFVAATFLRGMPLIHVPTSLVGMVDSSIGGKVALNHNEGKNLIGAFYQPRMVFSDVQALTTLPEREFISGWAEVIKHGLIRDSEYVSFLEKNAGSLLSLDPSLIVEAVRRSATIKATIVSADEKERGLRTILNYGHTIAHGLEAATGYNRMLHGEAVAVGMTGAADISKEVGLIDEDTVSRQNFLLGSYGLPVDARGVDVEAVIRSIELDKKVFMKSVRWVLLRQMGIAVIRDSIPVETVRKSVNKLV
ncbi:MAG: 3-dehydroquinate synthase [Dehalococcoidia bacterium]